MESTNKRERVEQETWEARKRRDISPVEPPPDVNNLEPHVETGSAGNGLEIEQPAQAGERSPSDASQVPVSETRSRPWVDKIPLGFDPHLQEAWKEKMVIFGHTIGGTEEVPKISFDVVGSTGNIYKVTVARVPRCDCPSYRMRKVPCKHVGFVLKEAMGAPEKLVYQQAFLASELCEMLAKSPLIQIVDSTTSVPTNERRIVAGECPICFKEVDPSQVITWCRVCGNNFHQDCVEKRKARKNKRDVFRCAECRAPWHQFNTYGPPYATAAEVRAQGHWGKDGYVNVAAQFGMFEGRLPCKRDPRRKENSRACFYRVDAIHVKRL